MSKIHTTITIDDEILEKAREYGWNISGEVDKALKNKINSKKMLAEGNLKVKCSECKKEIEEGSVCKESEKIICNDCGKNFNMEVRCRSYFEVIDGKLIHEHTKWPSWDNGFVPPEVKEIAERS